MKTFKRQKWVSILLAHLISSHSKTRVISIKLITLIIICRHVYIGGETPQTPLRVFDVGFAHDGGIPPTPPPKLGEDPQTPQIVIII